MRKLRIILADDLLVEKIEPMVTAICNWLDPIASLEAAKELDDWKRVEQRVAAVGRFTALSWTTDYTQASNWVAEPDAFDVAIIDLRWADRETHSLDTSGLHLLEVARRCHPGARLFQYTAHFNRIANEVITAAKQWEAEAVPILNLQEFVERTLVGALKKAAENRIQRMGPDQQWKLYEACRTFQGNVEQFVQVQVEEWRIADLAVGWRQPQQPHYPSQLPAVLQDLAKPNLNIAASLFFGVGPIKQITHNCDGFFMVSEPEGKNEMARAAEAHYDSFRRVLQQVKSKSRSLRFSNYEEALNSFSGAYQQWKSDPATKFPRFFSPNMMRARDMLRYGTSPNAVECPVEHFEKTGSTEFEIYVPVHRLFGTEIKACRCQFTNIEGTSEECILAACNEKSRDLVDLKERSHSDKRPKLTYNYCIFRYENGSGKSMGLSVGRLCEEGGFPKGFEPLTETANAFEYFGRLFMAFREDGVVKIVEFTHGRGNVREVTEDDILPPKPCGCNSSECCIRTKHLCSVSDEHALLIFRFDSWRQE